MVAQVPLPMPLVWRIRRALFGDRYSATVSLLLLSLLAWAGWHAVRWGVIGAVVPPDVAACRTAEGACWGVIAEKGRLVLLGRYPQGEQWRPVAAMVLLLAGLGVAAHPRSRGHIRLAALLVALLGFGIMMAGGVLDLSRVGTELWGGLPLTLFLAVIACLAGLPLGIALALARRSRLPALRWLATGFIEAIRGLPLITLLFFGAFVLPLVLPERWRLDPMLRIGVCLTVFCAAYLAEVVRGGLQAIGSGQYEAAHALGLTRWQTLRRIVLPQALRITIAPTASLFIGAVKDTSLVAIVNVYDLTGTLKLAMGDATWRPFFVEIYLLVSLVYLALGLTIAKYGRYLERRYALGTK